MLAQALLFDTTALKRLDKKLKRILDLVESGDVRAAHELVRSMLKSVTNPSSLDGRCNYMPGKLLHADWRRLRATEGRLYGCFYWAGVFEDLDKIQIEMLVLAFQQLIRFDQDGRDDLRREFIADDLRSSLDGYLKFRGTDDQTEKGISLHDIAMLDADGDTTDASESVKKWVNTKKIKAKPLGKCPDDARASLYRLSEVLDDVAKILRLSPAEKTNRLKRLRSRLRFPEQK